MRTRLSDIAERAGVSTFTVSCALRGRQGVSVQTAARIRELAKDMEYVPSAAARTLAAGRKRSYGEVRNPAIAVVDFGRRSSHSSGEHPRMVEAAKAEGYDLQVVHIHDCSPPAHLSRVLWSRGVQGLILRTASASPNFDLNRLDGFEWDHFSVVKISRGIDNLQCHSVCHNVFGETVAALERVVKNGYRRVGVLLTAHSASTVDDYSRLGAVRAFQELRGRTLEAMEVVTVESMERGCPPEVLNWISRFQPDVVIGFPVTWRVWMEMDGYTIPHDFAFVGLPVQIPTVALSGVATSGPLLDLLTMEFPAALRILQDELMAGRRGLTNFPLEHVLPVVWQKGVTLPEHDIKKSVSLI